ncbi:TIGR01777 family oxidoreductase [Muricauda sp. ANG21]|uniref:TIGR01777 family oxidoreductase n=1 Tax=Allomuricauda sp. ANG21 TaxID=3042468 RepID=UPI00345482CA
MKVLITGATGLVGQAIVRVLHNQGIAVNYVTTRKDKISNSETYQGYYWNPNKGKIDLECFKNVSAIINLAGASIAERWTPLRKKKILSSRINSLRTLYRGMEQVDISLVDSFVSASAIGIYPNSLSKFYDEDETEVDKSFVGEVAKKWEAEVDSFTKFDINVAKVRIGIVLSTEGGALPQMAAPIKNFIGAPLGSGDQWQSWIHIEDLAQMFVFILENNLKGAYNAVAPNPVTNTKMTKELARVMDRPLWMPNVPKFALKLLLGEMAYLLFSSQRVSSKKIENEGFVFQYPNICVTFQDLYTENEGKETAALESTKKEFV